MPVKIPDALPATRVLTEENIFVMTEKRSITQDIRALKIAILNLMPTKEKTETQLLRLIGNTPLQVEITLLRTGSYLSQHTDMGYLDTFYRTIEDVKSEYFDGLIITGAPVEQMDFEEVAYWPELVEILDWTTDHVTSTFHICWGAQAGLYRHYGIPKVPLAGKMFGVFPHIVLNRDVNLLRGFDDRFYAPHSRHTSVPLDAVAATPELEALAVSSEAGLYLAASRDGRRIFVTGHSEYDPDTLKTEYERDLAKGLPIEAPKNYFIDNDPAKDVVVNWRGHGNLLYSNWLNYYVYQETPYNL